MSRRAIRRFSILPLTVRVETLGDIATPFVLRGTPLPTKRSDTFSTAADNQSSVEVSLLLGERPLAQDNLKLGTLKLTGIPPAGRGLPQIKLEFSVDETCAVTARVTLQGSMVSTEQKFDPPCHLSDSLIAKALADAESARAADDAAIRKIEAVNRAKGLITKAEEQLAAGSNAKLNAAVAALGLSLASGDSDKIRAKSDELQSVLSPAPNFDFSEVFGDFFRTPARDQAGSKKSSNTATSAKRSTPSEQGLTSSVHSPVLGRIFGGGTFTLDSQLCFVLMPFADKFQPIYEDHIRPAIERAGLRCERGDEVRGTNLITWDIWERINRARFLLAELTDRNSNVFYELGLAHALSKDVVLLTQSMDFVPFDLKPLRCICYEFTPRGMQKLEKALAETIGTVMKIG